MGAARICATMWNVWRVPVRRGSWNVPFPVQFRLKYMTRWNNNSKVTNNERIAIHQNLLGLARRSGKLARGSGEIRELLRRGQCKLVILASDSGSASGATHIFVRAAAGSLHYPAHQTGTGNGNRKRCESGCRFARRSFRRRHPKALDCIGE